MKFAKVLRVITIPPVMALILVFLLWRQYPPGHGAAAIFSLTLLPVLSYPVWRVIPRLYEKGRPSQRRLAIVFSVVGYLIGLVFAVLLRGSAPELLVCLCYMTTGVLIALSSALRFRASGHAAGISGPIAVLALCKSPWFALMAVILVPVYWSSLRLKRHTLRELLLGTLYPVAAALLWHAVLF